MLGFRLFLHALRMVLGNLSPALRISAPVIVLYAITSYVIETYVPGFAAFRRGADMAGMATASPFEGMSTGLGLLLSALSLLSMIAFFAAAVAWHRYILLEEAPAALGPRWHGAEIWGYFVAGIVLGLMMIVVMIPLSIVAAMVLFLTMTPMHSPMIGAIFFAAVIYVPIVIVFYRLSPILPAAAIGRRLRMSEAWSATKGAGGPVLLLALISVLGTLALSAPMYALLRISPILALIWQILVYWVGTMIGISIVTTLYGHFVEKRDLNA